MCQMCSTVTPILLLGSCLMYLAFGMWHHSNKQVENVQWEYTVVSKYTVLDFKTDQDEECVLMLIIYNQLFHSVYLKFLSM